MKKKWTNRILPALLFVLILAFLGIFVFKEPTITGVVIYEEETNTLNWTFDDVTDFSYDNSLVEISGGAAKLISTTTYTYWNTSTETDYSITSALYDALDKTDKVDSIDNKKHEVKEDKLFEIFFSNELSNGDIVSLYINDGDQGDVYLCDYGDDCSTPGYGLVNFNGNEGWFNITTTGLSSPQGIFSINPDKDMKFDYIKAVHIDITGHSSTNISYPTSASIETKDISIASLSSFLDFHKNELLNDQNIGYYYSADSGNSWNAMPQNNNLSEVPVSSGKIRIKTDIAANGTETPIIYDFAVSYLTQICNEDWNLTYGICLSNDTKLKYYIDENECGTTNNLPSDNGTYESCVYDEPQNPTELLIDARNESNVLINIKAMSGISADLISITEYSANSKNSTPSLKELGRYIDITADDAIKQNLTTISIRVYYTDADIVNANLDEETLKIHYFNDTNNQWQVLNSTVNTTGNYIEVTVEHLSTFGIFGGEKESQSSESSGSPSSGSGGGGGKTRTIKEAESVLEKPVTTETKEEIKKSGETEPQETEKECDYKISVSIPEYVSFVEHDSIKGVIYNLGSCKIENLDIGISPELKDIIAIETQKSGNININESIEFVLLRKLENETNLLIQGFNIKIPKQNVNTYYGVLTFGAIVDEQLAFEEKINVKVDLLESASIINAIGPKAAVFLVFLGLFAVAIFAFYSRFFQKKKKLTQGQIDEIEEKIQEAERRYLNREK